MKNKLLFLHNIEELDRERLGYYSSLKQNYEIILSKVINEEILTQKFDFVLYGDAGILPEKLEEFNCPTICFQIDTFSAVKHRINISKLFDLTVVFHPGYEEIFTRRGVRNAILLPHAIDHKYFINQKDSKRDIDLTFVGDIQRKGYSFRKKIVESVLPQFKSNDYRRYFEWEEMISLFKKSKVVLNIPRDDYLIDANLRVFEATASGALLMNLVPTEIDKLGYEEGKHYVGFSSTEDLIKKIKYYLANEDKRMQIANAGRNLTLTYHNYDSRAKKLIEEVNGIDKNFKSYRINAYNSKVLYLKYYSKINHVANTNDKFLEIIKHHPLKSFLFIEYFFKPYIAIIKKNIIKLITFNKYYKN